MANEGRIFLLSPAFCGGRRARMLLRDGSHLDIAQRLRAGELTLGEAFSFMSGLYFRGKLTYARRFGQVLDAGLSSLVITPSRGLLDPASRIDVAALLEFAAAEVALDNPQYRAPLDRDAAELRARVGPRMPIVLLGSIATGKYADVLAPWFGDRLYFPTAFVGRGDMSRGGLLLRSSASGDELSYEPLLDGVRPRGERPPRLTPLVPRPVRLLRARARTRS
jgi:hypothetical protein